MDLANQNRRNESHPRQSLDSFSSKISIMENSSAPIKMSGYLEKRSKVLGWKRFWFVLDGRLLTYYKSKSEYESLSACCGSVNVGIATNVSPIKATKGYPLQIVTRTQVYYLRAADKAQLDRWLIAIQEAATIPPNISLPYWTDPGVQFYRYSFTSLSQWSLNTSTEDLTNVHNLPQNFYRPTSLLKKCHSFATLNFNLSKSSPKSSNFDYNTHSDLLSQSYNTYHSTLGYKSSSKSREMQEIIPRNNGNLSKMRHTSSMLVLESSPQAGELRRELARKLSTPTTLLNSKDSAPTPVFARIPKNQGSSSQSQAHPVGNIYNNYQNPEVQHDYDEILDLRDGIYEPCGIPGEMGVEGIYENVDNHPDVLKTRHPVDDPWEKLPCDKSTGSNSNAEPPRNRRSLQSRESTGRNSLVSIAEIPEKETSALPGRIQFGSEGLSSDIMDKTSDKDCDSISIKSGECKHKRKNIRLSKRSSITGFFQKIFTKDKKRKDADAKDMVITGPVDLRKIQRDEQVRRDSQSVNQEEKHLRTKQTSVLSQLRGLKPAVGSNFSSSEDLLQELSKKMSERRKSGSQDSEFSSLTRTYPETSVEVTTSLNKHEKAQPKLDSHAPSRSIETPPILSQAGFTSRNPGSAEYLKKLARFNRLSASLNPSFVAALGQTGYVSTVMSSAKVSRSQSCRVRLVDEPPMLPPKLKQVPKLSEYDVPQNNSPVRKQEENLEAIAHKNPVLGLRGLTKKHSAPDISFSPLASHGPSIPLGNSYLVQSLQSVEDVPVDLPISLPQYQRPYSEPKSYERRWKSTCAPQAPPRPPKPEEQSQTLEASAITTLKGTPEESTDPSLCTTDNEKTGCVKSVKVDGRGMPATEEEPFSQLALSPPSSSDPKSSPSIHNSQTRSTSEESDEGQRITTEPKAKPLTGENALPHPGQQSFHGENPEEDNSNVCTSNTSTAIDTSVITCKSTKPEGTNHEELEEENFHVGPGKTLGLGDREAEVKEADEKMSSEDTFEIKYADEATNLVEGKYLGQTTQSCPRNMPAPAALLAHVLEVPEMMRILPSSHSPTSSQNSNDIDNLEVLSDISSDPCHLSPIPFSSAQGALPEEKETAEEQPVTTLLITFPPSQFFPTTQSLEGMLNSESEAIVEECPVQRQEDLLLATQYEPALLAPGAINEDEDSHLYDDVPLEDTKILKMQYATSNSVPWETVEETEEELYEMYDDFPVENFALPPSQTLLSVACSETSETADIAGHHPGMDQLRDFLDETELPECVERSCETSTNFRKIPGRGTVNRLGHSSAIEQLKQIAAGESV